MQDYDNTEIDELEADIRHNDGHYLGLLKVIAYILLAILRKMR